MDVPDDDPSKLSEGTNEEAKEQPCEPKKEPEDAATPEGVIFRLVPDDISLVAPDSTLLLTKDGAGFGSFPARSVTPGDYMP